MNEIVDDLIGVCRFFGVFEREAVCCGTVTVPQCVALQALLATEHEIGQLASHLGISASAMVRLVDGLERRGWVRRARSAEDRRRVDVALTAEGKREALRLRECTAQGVALVLSRIPKAKHAQLRESLRLVRAALAEVRGAVGCCGAA